MQLLLSINQLISSQQLIMFMSILQVKQYAICLNVSIITMNALLHAGPCPCPCPRPQVLDLGPQSPRKFSRTSHSANSPLCMTINSVTATVHQDMVKSVLLTVKVGFHYPSSRAEFTGRVDGPRTRVHFLTPVNSGRELG